MAGVVRSKSASNRLRDIMIELVALAESSTFRLTDSIGSSAIPPLLIIAPDDVHD